MEEGMREELINALEPCRKAGDFCGSLKEQEPCRKSEGFCANPGGDKPETGSPGIDTAESAQEKVPEREVCPQSLLEMISAAFPGKRQDIRSYSALSLAYIGDVVYDLVIRTMVVSQANRPVNDLHRITVRYVSANAQSKIVQTLLDSLTEEEQSVYRRGKNAKPHTTAKNASLSDYLKATGFEAVLGYLYLTDQMERLLHLVKTGISLAGL